MPFYAHSSPICGQGPPEGWQPLADHLVGVANVARRLAVEACPRDPSLAEVAHAAGLLHDLGKYRSEFQLMLDCCTRGIPLPVPRDKTYHKQAGAAKAALANCIEIAFAIAGHHGGMPNRVDLQSMAKSANGREVADAVWTLAAEDCPQLAALQFIRTTTADGHEVDLRTRLLFSCLVDADWSDTSHHGRTAAGLPEDPPPPALDAAEWLSRLLAFIAERAAACRDPSVARARADVLEACLSAAAQPAGVYSLTVPTGGGKTLSALAFALEHARRHGLRRIIYVAPYLSIIDQNVEVIRAALSLTDNAPELFEHHSLADPPGDEKEDATAREAAARRAENWDAPLVVTTSVQLFESLFANKPSRCRKLHNIARSVVILDECQTLPPGLVQPTCRMLRQVTQTLGTTILLCTATQPAFDHDQLSDAERLRAKEIIPAELDLFRRLQRVSLHWPKSKDECLDWPAVADELLSATTQHPQRPAALCIVNTRRAAREVFAELQPRTGKGVFHLSTSMCPAHRMSILKRVHKRLKNGQPTFLVATQLIEAGVDVDFPFVMREMAPLEGIVQAAGRCNREGMLSNADGQPGGRVAVFRSRASLEEPRKYFPPDQWYKAGRSVVETNFLAAGREPRIDEPADIREYFTWLYHSGELDAHQIQAKRQGLQLEEVARDYHLIPDDGVPVVVATWTETAEEVRALLSRVQHAPNRANFRALAPHQVNLRRYEIAKSAGSVVRLDDRLDLFVWYGVYDQHIGLTHVQVDDLLLV